ncbi:hypothetical protein HK102_000115 [Quaeritorhiza haematococci]|nr:hypothetical protein HK102_000115 [Quaeritorhiza haematococci]
MIVAATRPKKYPKPTTRAQQRQPHTTLFHVRKDPFHLPRWSETQGRLEQLTCVAYVTLPRIIVTETKIDWNLTAQFRPQQRKMFPTRVEGQITESTILTKANMNEFGSGRPEGYFAGWEGWVHERRIKGLMMRRRDASIAAPTNPNNKINMTSSSSSTSAPSPALGPLPGLREEYLGVSWIKLRESKINHQQQIFACRVTDGQVFQADITAETTIVWNEDEPGSSVFLSLEGGARHFRLWVTCDEASTAENIALCIEDMQERQKLPRRRLFALNKPTLPSENPTVGEISSARTQGGVESFGSSSTTPESKGKKRVAEPWDCGEGLAKKS